MPLLEEVLVYIKGLWLLIQGNLEGYRWLDISESGLWRSFTAILWTLPALAVGWASWRLYYLSVMPTGTTVGIGFFGKLLAVDLVSWLLPIVLIAVLSRPLGFSVLVVPVIVTTNWLQVPLTYAMAVPAALLLVIPAAPGWQPCCGFCCSSPAPRCSSAFCGPLPPSRTCSPPPLPRSFCCHR